MMGRRFDGNLVLFLSVLNSFRKLRFYIYIKVLMRGICYILALSVSGTC